MRFNYVKAISISAVLVLLAIFSYIALEDPAHGEIWGGSYGENEVDITTTTTATLNGKPMTEETGFVMARGTTYTLQIEVSNNDMNDDIDTLEVTFPAAFSVSGGTPDVETESGENTDWNAEIVGSMIRFVAVSDFPGVNQTGGGFYYDISSKFDDALDYTQSGQFTVSVAAPDTSTIGAMTVKVSDSKTERGGAEYTESYPVLSVGVGDVFQYITVKGTDISISFRQAHLIGGGARAPGDAFLSYVLLKETPEERTYVVLGEDVEVVVEPLGEVAATYDLIIEKYVVSDITDGSFTAEVETKTFTDLNTEEVSSVVDTDGDGLYDFEDPDDDNDGWSDKEEIKKGTDPLDPTSHPEKEKKFPWWIVAVIVVIIVIILAYVFVIRGKGPVEEEVIPPSEEEVAAEAGAEEVVEAPEEEVVEEAAAPEEAYEAPAVEEEVEEEVYEVPAAEVAAAEVTYEDEELKELEGLSEELDEILEESEQLTCPSCGGVISAEDTVCPHCGAELEDVYICPACGAEVPPGATSCPSCGATFE